MGNSSPSGRETAEFSTKRPRSALRVEAFGKRANRKLLSLVHLSTDIAPFSQELGYLTDSGEVQDASHLN